MQPSDSSEKQKVLPQSRELFGVPQTVIRTLPHEHQTVPHSYVNSEASDNDCHGLERNGCRKMSGSSGSIYTPESEAVQEPQSALLATLLKLTKLWEEEALAEANGTTEMLENRIPHLGERSCPSGTSGNNSVTTKARESVNHSIEPGKTTTLMIRNIPLRFTPVTFRELIEEEGFSGRYDYLYMPMDFRSHRSLGYCFLNFYDSDSAIDFASKFSNRKFPSTNSDKVLAISAAARQGQLSNVTSFKLSTLKQMPKVEFRPLVGILGQLFPLDERVHEWLVANGGSDNPSPASAQGLASLWGISQSSIYP